MSNTSGMDTLARVAEAQSAAAKFEGNQTQLANSPPFRFSPSFSQRDASPQINAAADSRLSIMMHNAADNRASVPIPVDRPPMANNPLLLRSILLNQQRQQLMAGAGAVAATPAHNAPPLVRTSISPFSEAVVRSRASSSSLPMNAPAKKPPAAPSRRRKPNFAEKLHAVLSNKECRSYIKWLPSGQSFCIINKIEFTKKILPKHLREAKFESFSRRLKRWGFRKVHTSDANQVVFAHDVFHRDEPQLCQMMNGRDRTPEEDINEPTGGLAQLEPVNPRRVSSAMMMVPQGGLSQEYLQKAAAHNEMLLLQGTDGFVPRKSLPASQFMAMHLRSNAIVQQLRAPLPMPICQPNSPGGNGNLALEALNDDIRNCEQQLVILQKLKVLREHRRFTDGFRMN